MKTKAIRQIVFVFLIVIFLIVTLGFITADRKAEKTKAVFVMSEVNNE